jgi:hypothetical protein
VEGWGVMEPRLVAMELDMRVRCLVLHNTVGRGATVKATDLGTDQFPVPCKEHLNWFTL